MQKREPRRVSRAVGVSTADAPEVAEGMLPGDPTGGWSGRATAESPRGTGPGSPSQTRIAPAEAHQVDRLYLLSCSGVFSIIQGRRRPLDARADAFPPCCESIRGVTRQPRRR